MGFSFKKVAKAVGNVGKATIGGGWGLLGGKLLGGGGGGGASLDLLDLSGYDQAYSDLAGQMPGQMEDVESFYTPEMQQAVLAAMEEQIRQGGAQNQAAISGGAVQSGWGVGNTSREATRRAKADSDMLNEIVSSHIQNAQGVEQMRQQQAQEYTKNQAAGQEMLAKQKQASELASLGYTEGLTSQQNEFKAQTNADRLGMIGAGLGGLGQAAGYYVGGLGGKKPQTQVNPLDQFANTQNAQWYWPAGGQ